MDESVTVNGAAPRAATLLTVIVILFAVVVFWPLSVSAVRGMSAPVRIVVNLSPFVVIFAAVAVAARLEKRRFSAAVAFSTHHFARQMGIALVLLAITLSLAVIPLVLGLNMFGSGETRPLILLYTAVRTLLLVGFGEELVWRGYVFEGLRQLMGSGRWAVMVSSVLFGLWHFPGGQDFLQVITTAVIGAVYATARYKIRDCSTLATGTAHGVHDLTLLLVATFIL
ncbi:MAG: Abortive infection protein [Propionibacteriaceae bacterium]|jgi:membrane protease YdiL (CAAX protease family)|nr:Abortive infection protein [Propionibacteriaceae bacterium]